MFFRFIHVVTCDKISSFLTWKNILLYVYNTFCLSIYGHLDCFYLLSEEGNDNHSSIHAWRIPWMEEPGRLVHGRQRVGYDWVISLSHFPLCYCKSYWYEHDVQRSLWYLAFNSFEYVPSNGIFGSYSSSTFSPFNGFLYVFSQLLHHFAIPQMVHKRVSIFLHSC